MRKLFKKESQAGFLFCIGCNVKLPFQQSFKFPDDSVALS